MKLHKHQQALLDLLKEHEGDLKDMSLRDIAEEIGLNKDRAQVVAHHLNQLEDKGVIRRVNQKDRIFRVLKEPMDAVVYVNLYRSTAQCGPDGLLADDMIAEKIPLSSKTFNITNPEHFFLMKTRGESMLPLIHEGDLVLAHKQSDVDSGQIAVVVHEDMPKIKKVLKTNSHPVLVSLNKEKGEYNDEEVIDSDFRICGQVRAVIRVG
jgi:repressor LexA